MRQRLAWVLATAMAVVGCGEGEDKRDPGEVPEAVYAGVERPDPHPRPEGALTVAARGVYGGRYVATLRQDPKTFNAMMSKETSTSDLRAMLYHTLTRFNYQTHETEPNLAQSWDQSDDGRTWTFHLRQGHRWSDGHPLTADDIIFSSRILYDEDIHPSAAELCKVNGEPFVFEKVDDHTVEVRLPGPYGPFLTAIGAMYVVPRHKLEAAYREGRFEHSYGVNTPPEEIVTSGPWVVHEYLPQQRAVLRPNPHYFKFDSSGNRLPYLDEVVYLIVPDQDAMMLKFQGGESDEIYFRAEDYALLKQSETEKDFTIFDLGTEMGTQMVWFNQNRGRNPSTRKPYVDTDKLALFSDIRFRRAAAHAVDRQAISRTVYFGMAPPLHGPIPAANKNWHNPNIRRYEYDLDQARRILEDAGYLDTDGDGVREDLKGNPISITMITNANSQERVAMGNIIAADMTKIGIQCTLSPIEFNSLVTKLTSSFDYDMALMGLTGGVPPDPVMSANVFMSTGVTHFWYPRQESPATPWEARIDDLMNQQMALMDQSERKRLFDEVQRIVSENIPMIYTVSNPGFIAVRNKFVGLKPSILRPWVLWESATLSYNPPAAKRELAKRAGG